MPKNTYFIKENYKKVEEVREIKSEIPTYEEFLNNYSHERVNYDDLTHSDISLNKGYGPMWNSNSQYGERWTNLRIPCPVNGCDNTTFTNQTHTCGGQVEFSNKARIRCRSCGDIVRVRDFKFSCSNHGRGYTDLSKFTDVAVMALEYGEADRSFMSELLQSLRDSYRS